MQHPSERSSSDGSTACGELWRTNAPTRGVVFNLCLWPFADWLIFSSFGGLICFSTAAWFIKRMGYTQNWIPNLSFECEKRWWSVGIWGTQWMCFCWIHLCETPVATFSCQSWKFLSYFPTKKDMEDCPKMDLPKINGMLMLISLLKLPRIGAGRLTIIDSLGA